MYCTLPMGTQAYGLPGEDHLGELLEQAAVGLVVVRAAAFLLDDLALRVHADLLDLAVHHALALDPEREAEAGWRAG